ncbi:hypothetical protein IHE44_0011246 [Lamprotornis superbus]|uniref:Beta-1,4-galactosyltransferase n=1 Tax=Lamprotornis superbus TaxID=245042 RepID=A0A835TTY5_9PASS|nr:hypothetical protein IHE44_0011246 [Lamprotornis superbus]
MIGALRVEFSQPVNLEEVARMNPMVKAGGRFAPKDCIALQKVAIIIPFRNREEHLKYWLYYLHPILQRQQLDYGIYVINQAAFGVTEFCCEHAMGAGARAQSTTGMPALCSSTGIWQQDGEEEFNRAKLLNIGFAEALKEYDYNCFVFSDVDLIPMDDRNTYKCYSQPRHLSVSMDKFGFRLPYNQYFGGVSALSKEQFTKINGFPNNYWGWGGEDDDIYNRLVFKGMGISRPDAVIGKCRMIRHSRDRKNEPNPERFDRIAHTRETMNSDGLNTLSYKVLRTDKYPLYTKITTFSVADEARRLLAGYRSSKSGHAFGHEEVSNQARGSSDLIHTTLACPSVVFSCAMPGTNLLATASREMLTQAFRLLWKP